jgi:hypothetical protein
MTIAAASFRQRIEKADRHSESLNYCVVPSVHKMNTQWRPYNHPFILFSPTFILFWNTHVYPVARTEHISSDTAVVSVNPIPLKQYVHDILKVYQRSQK